MSSSRDTERRRLVVVGASIAGLSAVEAARRAGFAGSITLIGAERHLPYNRPPLTKEFLDDGAAEPVIPTIRGHGHLVDALSAELLLGEAAQSLDLSGRSVQLGDRAVPYDMLIVATGARPRQLRGAAALPGVHSLRTFDDALAIRRALDERPRVAVIGAGFIGSEIASAARKRGLEVTIVEAMPTPFERAVGTQIGPTIAGLHERNGTALLCGSTVESVEGGDRVTGLRLSDGSTVAADLVIVGIGAVPATEWLAGSGLTVADGVVCDSTMCTGIAGVYAAGDVARWDHSLFGRSMRLEHWTGAADQASAAITNALDPEQASDIAFVPYFWSQWYGTRLQFVGIPDAEEVITLGDAARADRWVALYREGNRVVGALTVNLPGRTMKYRALIARQASWDEAVALFGR